MLLAHLVEMDQEPGASDDARSSCRCRRDRHATGRTPRHPPTVGGWPSDPHCARAGHVIYGSAADARPYRSTIAASTVDTATVDAFPPRTGPDSSGRPRLPDDPVIVAGRPQPGQSPAHLIGREEFGSPRDDPIVKGVVDPLLGFELQVPGHDPVTLRVVRPFLGPAPT